MIIFWVSVQKKILVKFSNKIINNFYQNFHKRAPRIKPLTRNSSWATCKLFHRRNHSDRFFPKQVNPASLMSTGTSCGRYGVGPGVVAFVVWGATGHGGRRLSWSIPAATSRGRTTIWGARPGPLDTSIYHTRFSCTPKKCRAQTPARSDDTWSCII